METELIGLLLIENIHLVTYTLRKINKQNAETQRYSNTNTYWNTHRHTYRNKDIYRYTHTHTYGHTG